MSGGAYYNEIDPYCAAWLRNLIAAGHIAAGDVDERSIVDVKPDDLAGYGQCHFFAGIGGWSYALRLAGWPDDRPVWTGSCPCQPFSAAGQGKAADDERHLWPAWLPLIAERRPAIVLGEQVEAAVGWGWLDAVFADLEDQGYACGAAVLPACGIGAPHIRQRAWFVANAGSGGIRRGHEHQEHDGAQSEVSGEIRQQRLRSDHGANGATGKLVNSASEQVGLPRRARQSRGTISELGVADRLQSEQPTGPRTGPGETKSSGPCREFAGSSNSGFWRDLEWLPCTDGKARPVESGTFPLAHGIPGRVGRLRAYGNAIVPQVAAEFIKAAMT